MRTVNIESFLREALEAILQSQAAIENLWEHLARASGCWDLNRPQIVMLQSLHRWHGDRRSVVRARGIEKNISYNIDILCQRGYILRVKSESDGRVCEYSLTDKGTTLIAQMDDKLKGYSEQYAAHPTKPGCNWQDDIEAIRRITGFLVYLDEYHVPARWG